MRTRSVNKYKKALLEGGNHGRGRNSTGFSLIELMLALTLGALITWSVLEISLSSLKSSQILNDSSEINETGRYLTQFLEKEISMAGFLGRLIDIPPKSDGTLPGRWMCRPLLIFDDLTFLIDGLNNMSGSVTLCGTAHKPRAGSDVLMIRRTSSKEIAYNSTLSPANYYLQAKTGLEEGITAANQVVKVGTGVWDNFTLKEMDNTTRVPIYAYRHSFYFVDENKTLRVMYRKNNAWRSEPITDAVEDFQAEYGIDTNGDNVADKIGFPADRDEWQAVVSVKLSILVGGAVPQTIQSNTSFSYAGKTLSFNDRLKRRLFVSITEPINLTMRTGD